MVVVVVVCEVYLREVERENLRSAGAAEASRFEATTAKAVLTR